MKELFQFLLFLGFLVVGIPVISVFGHVFLPLIFIIIICIVAVMIVKD